MSRLTLTNRTQYRTDDLRTFVLAGIRAEGEAHKHYRVEVVYARQSRGCSGQADIGGCWLRLCVPGGRRGHSTRVNTPEATKRIRSAMARRAWAMRADYDGNTQIWEWLERNHARLREGVDVPFTERFQVLPARLVTDLGKVLVHELLHNRGVQHRGMARSQKRGCTPGADAAPVPWAEGRTIRRRPGPTVLPPEERLERRRAAREKSLRDRLAFYERRIRLDGRRLRKVRQALQPLERSRALAAAPAPKATAPRPRGLSEGQLAALAKARAAAAAKRAGRQP